jgi:adenylylsulfate kinase-like enzyme
MNKIKKKKGILFWITGLSGSGKTSLGEEIRKEISKKYGTTICVSGDDLREIFNYKNYSRKSRVDLALRYSKFCEFVTGQNINVIFSTVSMFHNVRERNKKHIKNYIEIYIKSNIQTLIRKKNKQFYKGFHKNIVGKNLKAEYPKNPDIVLENDFKISIKKLSKILLKKIFKVKV